MVFGKLDRDREMRTNKGFTPLEIKENNGVIVR